MNKNQITMAHVHRLIINQVLFPKRFDDADNTRMHTYLRS